MKKYLLLLAWPVVMRLYRRRVWGAVRLWDRPMPPLVGWQKQLYWACYYAPF